MEDNFISRHLYKSLMICIKYMPFLIAVLSLTSVICGCIGISTFIFAFLSHISLFDTVLWLLVSFTFRCCIWHRLPIYYCWTNNIISWIDFRWPIPINNLWMILLYSLIAIIFILLGMYFKNKANVKRKHVKTISS